MPSRSSIRPAEPDDVGRIAEFQTDCWRDVYRGLVPQDYLDRVEPDDRAPRWRHRLLSGERQIALAEAGAVLVGVVSCGIGDHDPSLELKSLYVGESSRGSGSAPVFSSTRSAADRPTSGSTDGNLRAQTFYRRHGFVEDGGRKVCEDTGLRELPLTRA